MSDSANLPYFHKDKGFWGWALTTDHKKIGVMYLFAIISFFVVAGASALLLRLELIAPGKTIMGAQTYNVLMTLHGAVMVFLFIVPGIPATLGNFLLPLMIGAKDVAFPRINLASWYVYIIGAGIALVSLLSPADTGWTFYAPYSMKSNSLVIWLTLGAFVMGFSSIMTGFNFIVTIHRMRCPRLTWDRLPLFVWGTYATSIIQVLATPIVGMTLVMLILERVLDIGIFNPAKGGDPILFEQFFWFYSHPVVYIMVLPAFGIISEVLPVFSRRPIFGYKAIAYSSLAIALVSFIVWGHHMFVSGMSDWARWIFSGLTFLVAIPTAIKVFNWTSTLWRGSIHFQVPMLYALGFVFMFSIAGLTGIHLAVLATDVFLHDTYFVVAHFHYTMQGGTVFALFCGLYYWFPLITGRMVNPRFAFLAWLCLFLGFNATFIPQFFLGMEGMPRRYYDYLPHFQAWHTLSTIGSWFNGLGYLMVIGQLFWSAFNGKLASKEGNPWNSLSMEWKTTLPPPPTNFAQVPTFPDSIYDYGTEGKTQQRQKEKQIDAA